MSDKPEKLNIRSDEGPVMLHMDSIESIGIENLLDVESHTINRMFNSVSHYIRFLGGGEVRLSYNDKGQIVEFSAKNMAADIVEKRAVLKRSTGKPGG